MNLFSYLKQQISILDIIGEYATLKKIGLYYKGICPFHHEKTPSFTVSPHKEIFYCFGCHSNGDAISFIEKAEHCSPIEAAHFLIERFQIDIPDSLKNFHNNNLDNEAKNTQKKQHHELCKVTAQWCHEQLLKSPVLLRYLKQRNINNEMINDFNIGYFPGGLVSIKTFINNIQQKGFLIDNLLEAHILSQGKMVFYSAFEDRILFPIKDHLGRNCGFGGRIFKKDDERSKYYNSKENPFFNKGSLLFGLDKAKQSIQQTGKVFLVEGYTDCIAMVQNGYANTVATLGTSCTSEHLKILSRYTKELYILYDGDSAGKKAVLRLTQLCWQVDLELKVLKLPLNEDPASFLMKNSNINELIDHAQDIFIFSIESATQSFSKMSLQEKISTVKELLSTIQEVDDPLKQEILLAKAAQNLDISLSLLKQEIKRLNNSNTVCFPKNTTTFLPNTTTSPSVSIDFLKKIPLLEKKLFSVIINNISLVRFEDREYLLEYLSEPLQELLKKVQKINGDTNQLDFIQFFDTLQEHEKLLASHLVLEGHEYEGSENLEYLLTEFQKKTWKNFITNTKIKLEKAQQENDNQAVKKILDQFQQLKKKLLHKGLI